MIYAVIWSLIALRGIYSQSLLLLRAHRGVMATDAKSLTARVARGRQVAAIMRITVFVLAILLAVVAVVVPRFSVYFVGPVLLAILVGFEITGEYDLRMWKRIDRAIRNVPGSLHDRADLERLDELDRIGR